MSKNNLSVRQELAALYRILDMYGMTDLANQCAAARSSENKNIYLVHQYGMFYDEITASSLIEIDNNGKPKDPKSPWLNDGCINLCKWIFNTRETLIITSTAIVRMLWRLVVLKSFNIFRKLRILNHLIEYIDYDFTEDDEYGEKFKIYNKENDILITRNHGYYTLGKTAEAFFPLFRTGMLSSNKKPINETYPKTY